MKQIIINFLTEKGKKVFYEVRELPNQNPRGVTEKITKHSNDLTPLIVEYNISFIHRNDYERLKLDEKIKDGLNKCDLVEDIDYKMVVIK